MAVNNVFSVWQIGQVREALFKPFCIRMLRRELHFDFFIVNDATLCGVDEEHFAWLQTTFLHYA